MSASSPGTGNLDLEKRVGELEKLRGKILWENPNPIVEFATQAIVLNSADFDCYEIFCRYSVSNAIALSQRSLKTYGTAFTLIDSDFYNYRKIFEWREPSKIQVYDTIYEKDKSVINNVLIPIKIIGYKF